MIYRSVLLFRNKKEAAVYIKHPQKYAVKEAFYNAHNNIIRIATVKQSQSPSIDYFLTIPVIFVHFQTLKNCKFKKLQNVSNSAMSKQNN